MKTLTLPTMKNKYRTSIIEDMNIAGLSQGGYHDHIRKIRAVNKRLYLQY